MSQQHSKVGVHLKFSFEDKVVHEFESYPVESQNIYDTTACQTVSYGYSGKMDGGDLPTPKVSGDLALVTSAIMDAKQKTEAFLIDQLASSNSRNDDQDD